MIYDIDECLQGTSRQVRLDSDQKQVISVLCLKSKTFSPLREYSQSFSLKGSYKVLYTPLIWSIYFGWIGLQTFQLFSTTSQVGAIFTHSRAISNRKLRVNRFYISKNFKDTIWFYQK